MSIDQDRKRLAQKHNLEEMRRELRLNDMITVFQIDRDNLYHERFIYSALIPDNQIEEALSDSDWDLNIGDGIPCEFSSETKYLRYGVENGVEPLVIHVGGYHPLAPWVEISEEFRLFHYLYHRDGKTDKYFRIDEGKEEVLVATVKPNHVQIRLREILQWLLLKDMSLSIQFSCSERSEHSIDKLGLDLRGIGREAWEILHRDELTCWRHNYADLRGMGIGDYQTDSKLAVKRLIKPVSISQERRYVEFIVNAHGDEYTCDPDKLGEYPSENSDLAWKLTRVYFRKQVLDKYYNEPSKYTVEDSIVRCSLWGSIKIDNHHPDKVCVFLDELGRHLPYTEQLHWRAYNIPPEGGVSETFYRRMVLGERANSDQPDILFKQGYEQLRKACDEHLGWQLLKSLDSGDEYRLKRLRVPTVDEESHFKDSILDLANILIERLNEERLEDLIPVMTREEIKRGINRLEYVLDSRKVEGVKKHIIFLRCLWDLRNTRGGSHPEFLDDSRYKRASMHFDLENLDRREAFTKILEEGVEFLDFLISVVQSGELRDRNDESC